MNTFVSNSAVSRVLTSLSRSVDTAACTGRQPTLQMTCRPPGRYESYSRGTHSRANMRDDPVARRLLCSSPPEPKQARRGITASRDTRA